MFFNFQKISKKTILSLIIMSFFVFSVLAQDNGSDFFGADEEEIACEDIVGSLRVYNADVQLNQIALVSTISAISSFLQIASDNKQIVRSELSEMIRQLEEVKTLIQGNEVQLFARGSNIAYYMEQCLEELQNLLVL